ncbi:MAG: hypothetical protein MMC23_003059 [Stictis urceolatum]|nr:hypothetical protein [Stictis urceolata]
MDQYQPLTRDSFGLSERMLTTIQRWLGECTTSHSKCTVAGSQRLCFPKRVLEVGPEGSSSLRLVDTTEVSVKGAYVTLSHCWGKHPILRLLLENLTQFKNRIDLEELPQTFRDAIEVTRALSVPYIWIDSLCIVQNSTSDWRDQAPLMSDVYSNAYCNIAATKAQSSLEGLFQTRAGVSGLCIVPFGLGGENMPHFLVDDEYWNSRIDDAPLNHRAWVVQERVLANRIVHFARDQIAWECAEQVATEEFPAGLPDFMRIRTTKSSIPKSLSAEEIDERARSHIQHTWKQFVRDFSKSDLTRAEDKLMAMSGIAKRMKVILGGQYLAGVWTSDLLAGLLWSPELGRLTSRPRMYRAPTWSWASLDGGVFPGWGNMKEALAEYVGACVNPVADETYGPVSEGYLKLRGRLVTATITLASNGRIEKSSPLNGSSRLGDVVQMDVWPANSPDGAERQIELCYAPLFISDATFVEGPQLKGLILEQAEPNNQGCYRRIGQFETLPRQGIEEWYTKPDSASKSITPELYEERSESSYVYRII